MDSEGWIEISLEVDGELAEAVAEMLTRYIPAGIVIESQAVSDTDPRIVQPEETLRIYGYFPIDEQAAETQERIEEGLWYLGRISPLPEPTYRQVREEDWSLAWRERFQPVRIGTRLLVQPAWLDPIAEPGRTPILIDPGMAFGTGTHPTTSLSLQLLESRVESGRAMIDIGCGSGILAIAALKLGAAQALGVDIDPKAVPEAEKNARLNNIGGGLELAVGSVSEIVAGEFALDRASLVAANIIAPKLIPLISGGLGDLVEDDGILILSGILTDQEAEITQATDSIKFEVSERQQDGDWVALALQAKG